MADIEERVQRAVEEIAGNEALLEMLETEAAEEMLNWGKTIATSIVKGTHGMDDIAAEEATLSGLKAMRQTMRAVGNWAVGKYTDPAGRSQLRDQLLKYLHTVFGKKASLPSAEELDALLNEVDNPQNTSYELILKWKELLNEANKGDFKNVSKA